jgi:cyclopropane fatty-acyl-phospholipid synthase-like methyltransferase
MTDSSTNGWEVKGWSDAWIKVVGGPAEIPADTTANVEAILTGYDGPRHNALEIGAGYGRLVKEMAKTFEYVVGIDSSNSLQEMSWGYLEDHIRTYVLINDGKSIPLDRDRFDFVYSYIAFQHMHTLEIIKSYIDEAFRVLKPGGACRIQTVKGKSNPSMVDGGQHRCHLFKDEKDFLQLFLDAGFEATVEVGVTHFQHIWVTGRKP